jgi:hypothetical protein
MGANKPHRLNVVGDFYVKDGCCTACGMPHSEAPGLFGWDDQEHCYVSKQPSTADEFRRMISAIACADLGCIRYRGQDVEVVAALAEINEVDKCDKPSCN